MSRWLSLIAAALALAAEGGAFSASRCVWVRDRRAEKNLSVSFRGSFEGAGSGGATLRVSASAVYEAYLNGRFVGWGPARTVKGCARIDEWALSPSAGRNVLVVEVAGYGFESSQYNGAPPFFAAESYAVDDDWKSWCAGGETVRTRLPLAEVESPRWLPREVPYPDFAVNDAFVRGKDAAGEGLLTLRSIDTGLLRLDVRCRAPGRVILEFDEALGTNGVIDLNRNGDPLSSWHACYNRLAWDVGSAGDWTLETVEPYTLKYLRIRTEGGDWGTMTPKLVQCRNPHVGRTVFDCSDPELNVLFGAAKESLAQNAVGILTDCPGRERVGWLCDTFFSSETAAWLTGDFAIEREYLLNYTRTDSFGAKIPKGAIPGYMPASRGGVMPTYMMWYAIQCAAAADRLDAPARRAFAAQVGGRIDGILDWLGRFERDGLLEDLPGWVFIEWSKANDYAKGVNFPANMLWALALERTARGRACRRPRRRPASITPFSRERPIRRGMRRCGTWPCASSDRTGGAMRTWRRPMSSSATCCAWMRWPGTDAAASWSRT